MYCNPRGVTIALKRTLIVLIKFQVRQTKSKVIKMRFSKMSRVKRLKNYARIFTSGVFLFRIQLRDLRLMSRRNAHLMLFGSCTRGYGLIKQQLVCNKQQQEARHLSQGLQSGETKSSRRHNTISVFILQTRIAWNKLNDLRHYITGKFVYISTFLAIEDSKESFMGANPFGETDHTRRYTSRVFAS